MKIIHLALLLILSIFRFGEVIAQHLELTCQDKHKIIKAGTYLRLNVAKPDLDPCLKNETKIIIGRLIQYDHGILKMQVNSISDRPTGDSLCYYHTDQVFNAEFLLPTMEFKKEDVVRIVIKGKNKSRKYATGTTIGHVISVIGFGHLVSAPIVGEDDAGLLIGLGLAEFFGGFLISSAFHQPSFLTHPWCMNESDSGKKIWEIK